MADFLRVPPPQYHPAASAQAHTAAMHHEVDAILYLYKLSRPIVNMQSLVRGWCVRRWARRRRTGGNEAVVIIQQFVRRVLFKRAMAPVLAVWLSEEAPEVCNDDRVAPYCAFNRLDCTLTPLAFYCVLDVVAGVALGKCRACSSENHPVRLA